MSDNNKSSNTHVKVSITAAIMWLYYQARARVACALIGAPGVGKTAIVYQVGRMLNLPVHALIGSTLDPTDVGGIPIVVGDTVLRVPLKMIRECCDKPGVLFLDEVSQCAPSVRAALMRVFHERAAGDFKLHKDTVVFAAFNPPEYADGATELGSAFVNRQGIAYLQPTREEFQGYLIALDGDVTESGSIQPIDVSNEAMVKAYAVAKASDGKDRGPRDANAPTERSTLNKLAREYAALLEVEPRLVSMAPPQISIEGGMPWASPRAIEKGLRSLAVALDDGADMDSLGRQLLAGWWGEATADAYVGIKRMQHQLPGVEEVCRNPDKAKKPETKEQQVAALGLLANVADKNSYAAWIYTARLDNQEIIIAAGRLLTAAPQKGPDSMRAQGWAAMTKVLATAHKRFGGVMPSTK